MNKITRVAVAVIAVSLTGCASLSSDGNLGDINTLTKDKTGALVGQARSAESRQTVTELLSKPLTAQTAVSIALLNNPGLHASMATLNISDADRVQAATLPNPHFMVGRFTEGNTRELERSLQFNLIGLLALPWRAQWQSQQHEQAKLEAATQVVKLAAATRKAWIKAVAAAQSATYFADAKSAAESAGELARRMARVGNWSRLEQAREQLFLSDATVQLARANQVAFSEREKLIRLLGLWGEQTNIQLPERLPDLPAAVQEQIKIEEQALNQRLDVRSVKEEAAAIANSLGVVKASGFLNALDLTIKRDTITHDGEKEFKRGAELEFPIPIFDWGRASNARAQANYNNAISRLQQTAVQARSDAREAYYSYRTAFDIAIHTRDELVPLRKFISEELLLRYNGMLSSVFELLGDMRTQILSVNTAIEAQRDFWLAEADLQMALTGASNEMSKLASGNTGASDQARGGH